MGKEQLLNIRLKSEDVTINDEVYQIKEMTGEDATDYENSLFSMVNGKPVYNTKEAKQRLVALTLYQNDEKVFDKKDLALVNRLPASLINKLFNIATKINAMDPEITEKN